MEIVNPQIERYLDELYGKRHEVLVEMEAESRQRNFPIVGPLVGKLLYRLAKMVNARRVFEMGSGYGYSAFWWALAMNGGEVYCTEGSDSNKQKGEAYLKRAGFLQYVKYNVGDALDIVFVSLMQKKGETELFMEVISDTNDTETLMKQLSDLREKSGINKLIRENKIHTEIFDKILEV